MPKLLYGICLFCFLIIECKILDYSQTKLAEETRLQTYNHKNGKATNTNEKKQKAPSIYFWIPILNGSGASEVDANFWTFENHLHTPPSLSMPTK